MNEHDHQFFHELYQSITSKAARESQEKDYATVDETSELLGMDMKMLEGLIDFIIHITQIQLSIAVEKGHVDDDDWNDIMNTAVGNAAVSALILKKGLDDRGRTRKTSTGSEYPTTLMAEAHIRKYLNDKADLNKIWPMDLAEEVAGEFEPAHAFLVGVVCGSQNG